MADIAFCRNRRFRRHVFDAADGAALGFAASLRVLGDAARIFRRGVERVVWRHLLRFAVGSAKRFRRRAACRRRFGKLGAARR